MTLQDYSAGTQPRVRSIHDSESCREAALLIKEGHPVGAFVRYTCAIWVDADNPHSVKSILRIKGVKRTGKPLSTILYADALVQMVDLDKIRPDLRPLFEDAEELAARLSLLCFLRVPITEEAAGRLPEVVISKTPDGTPWIQNCVPGKHQGDFPLVDQMLKVGITLPSATSMNVSGQPEIIDQQDALAFCSMQSIPLFLSDLSSKSVAKGSYPIVSIGPDGAKLVREGHFPGYLFRYLLQTDVDTSQASPARFPVFETHCERCASEIEPRRLHDEIMTVLEDGRLP